MTSASPKGALYDAPRLINCTPEPDYRLWLRYADGVAGRVNLENLIDIGAFKLFRDRRVFATARLDVENGYAVSWPVAGIRLDASILYLDLRSRGAQPAQPGLDADFGRFMARALESIPKKPRGRKP